MQVRKDQIAAEDKRFADAAAEAEAKKQRTEPPGNIK
jgi:hypothetical protein